MPHPQIIPPDNPVLDRTTSYRVKPSFWLTFSGCAVFNLISWIIIEIIHPILSVVSAANLPLTIAIFLWGAIVTFSTTHLFVKYCDFIITPTTISGFDAIGLWRKQLNLQDIETVKLSKFSPKNLQIIWIKSKKRERAIVLSCFYYDTQKILSRVRECAGDNHPLTLELEKVVALPPAKPFRVIWRSIAAIAIVILTWLIGGNLVAASQEQTLNKDIAAFVRQHPTTPPNQSAIDLQAAMSKLGLSAANYGDGSKVKVSPTLAAVDDRKSIEPILNKYVDERLNKNSLAPLPAQLATYLTTHRADIEAIKSQLIDRDLPEWGSDTRWIDRSDIQAGDSINAPLIKGFDLIWLQKLLFIDIADKQSSNSNIARDLQAIDKLDRSFHSQTLMVGQLFDLISNRNANNLVRALDRPPAEWERIVDRPDRAKMMRAAIDHESMILARMMQDPKLFELMVGEDLSFSSLLRYHHLARPHNRIFAVNYHRDMQQQLDYWEQQNVCRTDGKNGTKDSATSPDTIRYTLLYPKMVIGNLDRELTIGVRQIKSQLQSGGSIEKVANEFALASQTCPGEKWTARVKNGAIAISFSHPPNWEALGMKTQANLDRLTYKIQPQKIAIDPEK
jgi:hypothetical protein